MLVPGWRGISQETALVLIGYVEVRTVITFPVGTCRGGHHLHWYPKPRKTQIWKCLQLALSEAKQHSRRNKYVSTYNCLLDQKPWGSFKCYTNLKFCSAKQLFTISEEETLSSVVSFSLHPAAALSLLSEYSFPLFTLVYEIISIWQHLYSRAAAALVVSPAASFPSWQPVSKEV